jgi:hypothetical protein
MHLPTIKFIIFTNQKYLSEFLKLVHCFIKFDDRIFSEENIWTEEGRSDKRVEETA